MSYNPSYPIHHHSKMLLTQIGNAFKQVNLICREYFEKSKQIMVGKREMMSHINFNNYKGASDGKGEIEEGKGGVLVGGEGDGREQGYKSTGVYEGVKSAEQRPKKPQRPSIQTKIPIPSTTTTTIKITPTIKKPQSQPPQQPHSPPTTKPPTTTLSPIPAPPKAPLSPYFTFYKDKKDIIKSEFPDMSVTQIASAAAKVWKSLSDQEKNPYTKMYFQEKEKYDSKMRDYTKKYPNYKEVGSKKVAGN